MRRSIIWQKWVNPLGGGEEYISEDKLPDPVHADDEAAVTSVRPVVPTVGGLMPLTLYGHLGANFDFWMMHTNFNLSSRVKDILKQIPGVETLDIAFRYRCRVGFGLCFNSAQVRLDIQEAMNVRPNPLTKKGDKNHISLDPEMKQKLKMIENEVRQRFLYWIIYVIPNGEVILGYADKGSEYENFLDLFRQSQLLAGGIILTSHDE